MKKIENTVSIHDFVNKLDRRGKDAYLIWALNRLAEGYNEIIERLEVGSLKYERKERWIR